MSQRALLLAARDRLRTALAAAPWSLGEAAIELRFDGQPTPSCGETYVAVHPYGWRQSTDPDSGLDELYGCQVTVTRRLGFTPKDRDAVAVWARETTGLEPLLRAILVQLAGSGRYAVIVAANETYLGIAAPGYPGGLVEPLCFLDGGNPDPKGPDWFSAEDVAGGKWANAGVAQTLTFGGARRAQAIGDAT